MAKLIYMPKLISINLPDKIMAFNLNKETITREVIFVEDMIAFSLLSCYPKLI